MNVRVLQHNCSHHCVHPVFKNHTGGLTVEDSQLCPSHSDPQRPDGSSGATHGFLHQLTIGSWTFSLRLPSKMTCQSQLLLMAICIVLLKHPLMCWHHSVVCNQSASADKYSNLPHEVANMVSTASVRIS